MVSIRQLLADKLFGVHSASTGTQVEIQRAYTGLGAEFGQKLTNSNITFALKREPVAHKIVFQVAHDIFDKWFKLEPLEEAVDKEKFNEEAQKVLVLLEAKDVFTQAAIFERAYGWSIVVVGYRDRAAGLADPLLNPQEVTSLEPFPPTVISDVQTDDNVKSTRFGLPETYKVKVTETSEVEVHYSRVIHFATRLLDHPWKGISVLEPVWDDLTVLRNIRWGLGQTLYRYGSGFPVVSVKDATKEELKEYQREWGPLHARTSLWTDESTEVKFEGLAGRALNPEPYYVPIMENISAGSGIPMPILRGAQAGTLAGSEVNEREYFKLISDAQSRYEPGIMSLIDRLMETGQIQDVHYKINWLGGFELNPRDQAAAELDKTRSLQVKTNWMTVNELREAEGLEPIPGGDVVLELLKLQAGGEPLQTAVIKQTSKRKLQLEKRYGKPWDRLLTEKINRGDSVNKICRDLGISTSTFYQWMEELKEDKRPVFVYAKPQKSQPEKEKRTDIANLIPVLVEAVDARISQRLQMLETPMKRRIFKTLTDEDGKKLTEETVVEIE